MQGCYPTKIVVLHEVDEVHGHVCSLYWPADIERWLGSVIGGLCKSGRVQISVPNDVEQVSVQVAARKLRCKVLSLSAYK